MSKELTLVSEPNMANLTTQAEAVTKSGMFGLKSVNQTLTLMLIAEAENIPAIQAVQMYSVINGMPSLKSTEVQSRFQRSGGKVEWLETTDKKAVAKLTHPEAIEYISEFTMEQAMQMGLANKDNYKKMPKAMLMARAITSGVRAIYPMCLNNMYSVDEMMDNVLPEVVEATIVNAEIITEAKTQKDHTANKRELSKQLTALSFTKADVTAFAKMFDLGQDTELVEELITSKESLMAKIKIFEEN